MENTFVYVNLGSTYQPNWRRARCLTVKEDTILAKVMLKGRAYEKDEAGEPVVREIAKTLVALEKPKGVALAKVKEKEEIPEEILVEIEADEKIEAQFDLLKKFE